MKDRPVLCILDPDARGEQVLRQAAALARRLDSPLVLAHFVEHDAGFEADHVPFLTPRALNEALAEVARTRYGTCPSPWPRPAAVRSYLFPPPPAPQAPPRSMGLSMMASTTS